MKKFVLICISFLIVSRVNPQTSYEIDINTQAKEIIRGHLDLGGKNLSDDEISVNNYFIEKNDKPFYPIIGEFHYSRYDENYWEEEIRKIKAGGINTVGTYVFWNLHERQEGKFDWNKNLNLRKFLELVKKNNMYAIVRIGPFCHGEMRNGGLPDWLYGREFEIRSNYPQYLNYVDNLYGEIASQLKGLLFKDGGVVIGVQLENEYQHSAAPWEFTYPGSRKEFTVADKDAELTHEQITVTDGVNPWAEYGKEHMAILKEIAKKNGIDVPLYTATGWGNAAIVEKGSVPVTAAYAYPFWSEPKPSPFYLFKDVKNIPDYMPVSYDTELYPSIAAEIGAGIQVKYSRRPIVDFKSVNPLMVRIIGSGSNGIGYYMYHGGSTPSFDGKFFNEEVNGIPRINYDFQAPIGQYGQTRYHFKSLRMLHMFLESYGKLLAPMQTIFPKSNADITPEDTKTLRYAVRSNGNSGFLFLINFQDHIEMKNINDVNVKVIEKDETINFPLEGSFNLPKTTNAIFPFNLKLDGITVKSATVQPLTILNNSGKIYYVFSAIEEIEPEIIFLETTKLTNINNADTTTLGSLKKVSGKFEEPFSFKADGIDFLIVPQEMALNATKIKDNIYFSQALLLNADGNIHLVSRKEKNVINIFPAKVIKVFDSSVKIEKTDSFFNEFSSYKINFNEIEPDITIQKVTDRKYLLKLNSDISNLNDIFIDIDYIGDRGMAFIDGKMITDHFYHERKWEIGLKQFATKLLDSEMVLIFHPMHSDYNYLKDLTKIPEFEENKYLKVNDFDFIQEYKAILEF